MENVLKAVRSELVPAFLALGLLVLYAQQIVSGADVSDGLQVLVAAVVAFYYGARKANGSSYERT